MTAKPFGFGGIERVFASDVGRPMQAIAVISPVTGLDRYLELFDACKTRTAPSKSFCEVAVL